jgi:hypothetical protein
MRDVHDKLGRKVYFCKCIGFRLLLRHGIDKYTSPALRTTDRSVEGCHKFNNEHMFYHIILKVYILLIFYIKILKRHFKM